MEIRHATIDDYPAITRLEAEIQDQHVAAEPGIFLPDGVFSHETYAATFANPSEGILLCIEADAAVGYLHYQFIDEPQNEFMHARHFVHIHALSIKATHRRRGCGEALMNHVIDLARKHGKTAVTLEVWAFNTGAQAFYRQLGFQTYLHKMRLDFSGGESPTP